MKSFEELKVDEKVILALQKMGINNPTPVQEKAIPIIRTGKDAIVMAPTGTGKTIAFLLPLLAKMKSRVASVQTLIITPTRELTIQIAKVAAKLGEVFDIKTLAIYGGQDIERQKKKLGRQPQLIIGTPGRLLDHLRRKTIDLSTTNKVVLDEADEMLKRGFIEDAESILETLAADRQLLLFSATIPERVRYLAHRFMDKPTEVTIEKRNTTLESSIKQTIIDTTEETKVDKLCELINTMTPYLAMVFCRTKERVHGVMMALASRGYLVDELHGGLTQAQRALVMKRFREAKLQTLITTDIAARGLDIEGVTHVFNYDIPYSVEEYIHRIGRTGRAEKDGVAVTFVNARQYELLRKIEAGIKNRIDKERSERKKQKEKINIQMKEKVFNAEKQEKSKKKKPLSKYANRKGASHKGRNPRSRRNTSQSSIKNNTKNKKSR